MANTFSNKPWSDFKASDYTDQQYMSACLIKGDTKDACKLPIKEPSGTLNKNGIHAAAAALAGARGGLKGVSPADKKKAAKKLLSLYKEMGDEAPDSLYRLAGEKKPAKKS